MNNKLKKIGLYLSLVIGLIFFGLAGHAQTISPRLFGQNAWMPDSIGKVKYYGKLESKWPEVTQSHPNVIRYGGIGADKNNPTKHQYIKMIDAIRATGAEPIIQVSFHNYAFTAAQAADIVKYVNITMGRNVKYWIIANEPDLEYSFTSASQVAPYFKAFASAMKAIDPSIKTVGPETAWYNTGIIDGLTTPGGPNDITGKDANGRFYADVISFHTYPFSGGQTRAQVVAGPTGLDNNLAALNARIANCNSVHGRTGDLALKTAVTEANIDYKNSDSDGLNGQGAMSFIGGQFWAEMLGVAMKRGVDFLTFWSVMEGNSAALNIGFIDKFTGKKQPTYYHFQMMSENFKGSYVSSTDNQANVKTIASKDGNQVVVMLLNEDLSNNMSYTVRLDNSPASGSNTLKVNANAGIAKEYTGTINNQSTTLLVFNSNGDITKKIEYKLNGHADANLPPTVTNLAGTTTSTVTATITPAGPTTFVQGGSVVLNANTGSGLTYQWNKNGAAIAGATAPSYTATAAGSYTVVVKNATSSATSAAVTVTVTTTAALTATITASGPTTFAQGGSVTLTANTTSGATYQWNKNGVAIAGATGVSYVANASGSYTVTKKSGTSTVTSAAVTVTVSTATLTATVTASGPTTFAQGGSVTLTANSGTNYVYQWKKDGVVISGATAQSYRATTSGSYQVKITQGTASAWSAPVTVSVTAPIALTATITPQGSTSFCPGGNVVLKANTGTNYTYVWKKNGTAIAGATASSYTATASGSYVVVVKNGTPTATSAAVNVDATGLKATVTASGPTTFNIGGSVMLNSNTSSTFTYQWKKNGVAIAGATAASYKATTSGSYQVKITQGTCVAWSAPVTVTAKSATAKGMDPSEGPDGILQVSTYPNPTNGALSIDFSTAEITEGKVQVEMINYIGQIVMNKNVDVQNGVFHETVQLDPSLASGTYLLRITEGKFTTVNRVVLAK